MKLFVKLACSFALALSLRAATITVIYGDNDGFGTGALTYKDPTQDNAGLGEALFTDVRLIGTGYSGHGPFSPTTSILFLAPSGNITSVLMTLSLADFGSDVLPVDGPNSIVIDGTAVSTSFLGGFANLDGDPNIETRSFSLPSNFFAVFADGSIDLTGTRISESNGAGSFQVDYLSFDITSDEVPEPSTSGLLSIGLAGVALVVRRQRSARSGVPRA